MKKLKKQGYDIVLRSAGSHSPIDVIGIKQKGRIVTFIQSKPRNYTKKQKNELTMALNWLNDEFMGGFRVE